MCILLTAYNQTKLYFSLGNFHHEMKIHEELQKDV